MKFRKELQKKVHERKNNELPMSIPSLPLYHHFNSQFTTTTFIIFQEFSLKWNRLQSMQSMLPVVLDPEFSGLHSGWTSLSHCYHQFGNHETDDPHFLVSNSMVPALLVVHLNLQNNEEFQNKNSNLFILCLNSYKLQNKIIFFWKLLL